MTLDECQAALELLAVNPNHTLDADEREALDFAIGVVRWATRRPSESHLYRTFGEGLNPLLGVAAHMPVGYEDDDDEFFGPPPIEEPETVRIYDADGEPHDVVLRTKTGKVITEAEIARWASEAEDGHESP